MATPANPRGGRIAGVGAKADEWERLDFTERVRIGVRWFLKGQSGFPISVYQFHATRFMAFLLGWLFFCSFTPGVGHVSDFRSWIFDPVVFQKGFLWGSLFEVLGLGCASGKLAPKLWPPFTAYLHFLSPGTLKQPPFPKLPLFGGTKRTVLDVALYAGLLMSLVRALVQPEIQASHLIPIVVLLPLCGLGDKTVLLAARVEHHFAMIVCFLLASEWIAASKWVQLGVWFWAGISKLTIAFPYVVPSMTVNNALMRSQWIRDRMYVSPPDDLRPSLLSKLMAHGGGFLEFAAPLTLVWVTQEGPLLYLGLVFVLMLHGFIISNMPVGSVFEWNILNIYTAFFLFYANPEVSLFAVGSLPLSIYLVIGLLVLPTIGNFYPAKLSFLVSMRYYAGNWAWSSWWFRDGSYHKLDKIKRVAPLLFEQHERNNAGSQAGLEAASLAMRTILLQGRTMGLVLPRALDGPFQDYRFCDGERVADSVLGWSFGDGHLHDERLVAALQEECGFEPGELRVICVEAQPLFGSALHWRIVDGKDGVIEEGHAALSELVKRDPWDYGPLKTD